MRLDHHSDRQRLEHTVQRIRPRLVLLDPLVRLHGVDENAVAEIAPILGFLRDLQRRFGTAVLLVHHSRKSGASRPGQALRGSSELHAWGDSNLYLRRRDNQIVMTVEHRAAPGLNDVEIELADDGKGPLCACAGRFPTKAVPEPQTVSVSSRCRRRTAALAGSDPATRRNSETPLSAPPSKNSSARDASNRPPKPATPHRHRSAQRGYATDRHRRKRTTRGVPEVVPGLTG